ncbi:MAG: SDR family oxidoreductase [Pseudohongiella sp.]|nr:SDR family oxidoreductase [Pseudohongiella sp.]
MKARIFITGGSGLLALNWAVYARERFEVMLGLHHRSISLKGVLARTIDLESTDSLIRTFEVEQPDVVVHTVGLTSVEKCEADPTLSHHVNVRLAENVARACARLNIRLVYISTDHLFTGQEALVNEAQPTAPLNVYGKTKAEAELRILDVAPTALVIRTNFYAWGTSYRQSFSDVILGALRSGKGMTLFQDVFYTPILVEEAARAVHELIELEAEGIFNIVGDERISKSDFGLRLVEQFNLDPSNISLGLLSDRPALVTRPFDMSLSNHKVCKAIGRKLGGVTEHLAALHQQESNGLAQELKAL